MKKENFLDEKQGEIFLLCLVYGFHMVEEFKFGFVEWANKYFGSFDWTQNLIGNSLFFVVLSFGCYLYYRNPTKYLWVGMAGSMWVLSNSFLHISSFLLTNEYSPGVVTATLLYIPCGIYFLIQWGKNGVLNWKNLTLSFIVGGMIFMLIPSFVRSLYFHAKLAEIFHLVS